MSKIKSNSNDHTGAVLRLPPLDTLIWLRGSDAEVKQQDSGGKSLFLCVLIQANCPGCHRYALPLISNFYKEFQSLSSEKLVKAIYVISTAFEDFEYNTVDSMERLLRDQELVGAAKLALGSTSACFYEELRMPVAHDVVVPKVEASESLRALAIEAIKAHAYEELKQSCGNEGMPPPAQLELILKQINDTMLPEQIAHSFYAVQARGTPTWVLHESDGRVVDQHLGPFASIMELKKWIQSVN